MASRTAYSTWTPQKPTLFDGHYLRNRSTLDIGVLGYIGIVQHKEQSPEVLSIPPGTFCIILNTNLFHNFFMYQVLLQHVPASVLGNMQGARRIFDVCNFCNTSTKLADGRCTYLKTYELPEDGQELSSKHAAAIINK